TRGPAGLVGRSARPDVAARAGRGRGRDRGAPASRRDRIAPVTPLVLLLALATAHPARHAAQPKTTPAAEQRVPVEPIAIVHGLVHPVTSADLPDGTVLLRDGRIEAVVASSRGVP